MLAFAPTPTDGVAETSIQIFSALPPGEQVGVAVRLEAVVLEEEIVIELGEPRPGFMATVALEPRLKPLESTESPTSTPAVADGAIFTVADASSRVCVLLPLATPAPIPPPAPTEGVMAADRQKSRMLPPL